MKNNQLSPATYLSGEPMTLASLIANGIVGACPECGSKEICTHDSLSPATPAMRTDPLTPLLGLTMAEGISDALFGSCRGSEGPTAPLHNQDSDCKVNPETLICDECGVDHSDECPDCGGRGFHQNECVCIAPALVKQPTDDCECAEVEDIGDALARVSRQAFNALASEYANSTCEVDADYDVWDTRGHWWSDETQRSFVAWVNNATTFNRNDWSPAKCL